MGFRIADVKSVKWIESESDPFLLISVRVVHNKNDYHFTDEGNKAQTNYLLKIPKL